MPAYTRCHDADPMVTFCPRCMGLPLQIRDIEPAWSAGRLDVVYECTDCGTEVRETMTRAERH